RNLPRAIICSIKLVLSPGVATLSRCSGPAYHHCYSATDPAQSGGLRRGWRYGTALHCRTHHDVGRDAGADRGGGLFAALRLARAAVRCVLSARRGTSRRFLSSAQSSAP